MHSKVIEVRPKFVLENNTGMDIEMKQVGLPDVEDIQPLIGDEAATHLRGLRVVPNGSAQPVHLMQENYVRSKKNKKSGLPFPLERAICIRPVDGQWEWSGQYTPEDKEQYFGMRLLHRFDKTKFLILPVTVAVGKGTVLISVQNPTGVPPYRLTNMCSNLEVSAAPLPPPSGTPWVDLCRWKLKPGLCRSWLRG